MTGPVVKAEMDGVIYLIIGVFWVVAQIAGAAAKKKQPPRSGTDEEREPPIDPITELLRKMAGVQPVEVPQPEYKKPEEEALWTPDEIEKLPDIQPLRREPQSNEIIHLPPAEVIEMDFRPKMSAFRSSVPSIKLPAMNMSFQGSATSVRKAPELGSILNPSDRRSIRRAMLSHIIFSKPKAFEQ
jgi:hypothetical protein